MKKVVIAILSLFTFLSLGSVASAAQGNGAGQPSQEQVVRVNCDQGQSVQRVLNQFLTATKPLVLIIRGVCDEDVEVERNEVLFEGDETGGRITGAVRIDEAREFELGENMRIGRLNIPFGQAEIEIEDGSVVIDNGIGLTGQSGLTMGSDGLGTITVNADIEVENQSLLTTDGGVVVNGGISLVLQSSANMDGISVANDFSLSQDSHALFGVAVTVSGSLTCDRQSRVWGDVSAVSSIGTDADGISCWADTP